MAFSRSRRPAAPVSYERLSDAPGTVAARTAAASSSGPGRAGAPAAHTAKTRTPASRARAAKAATPS
ncbi:hypothetical protein, partial [Streptomyces sp. KL110A]|uniref:hypothetical protein n=1 Tax=Streptomyces sp. KL110A TaxID=3384221 RepID=UPI0038BEA212